MITALPAEQPAVRMIAVLPAEQPAVCMITVLPAEQPAVRMITVLPAEQPVVRMITVLPAELPAVTRSLCYRPNSRGIVVRSATAPTDYLFSKKSNRHWGSFLEKKWSGSDADAHLD